MSEEKPKVELNVVQVVASALAAVSSAVLLSTVGVAGTIIGAAAGSVIATVGASVYSYSLRVSRERVTAAQAAAVARMSRVRTGTHTRTVELEDKPEDEGRPPWREALARLPWKWLAIVSGAVFLVAMIVILSFELITGQAVSNLTHGSNGAGHRTSLGFGSSTATHSPTPTPTPSPSASASNPGSPSQTPTPGQATAPSATPGGPASDAPTRTPSVSSAPTTSAPTTTAPSSEPSASPTG